MQVINQKPIELSPIYSDNIKNDFDVRKIIQKTIAQPLFTPLIPGQPVTMDYNGTAIDEDLIIDNTIACCDNQFDKDAEALMKEVFGETLTRFNKKTNLTIRETFLQQSGNIAKLPEPNPGILYTPSADIIPTAKEFLAGQCDFHKFFASLGYWARPVTLGVYFINELAFDEFKTWMAQQMSVLGGIMPQDTAQMMSDFQKIKLKELTESILLRNNDGENLEPWSFARVLISFVMNYANQADPAQMGLLPFDIAEWLSPKTLVFVNIEKHARSTPKDIAEEWTMIKKAITQKPKMLSNNQIMQLTAQARNLKKITQRANYLKNMPSGPVRAVNTRLKDRAPSNIDIAKLIMKVMEKMTFVNYSMNVYKTVKPTFNKPNRRDPDDYNKQGKTYSTRYKPDLHIYVDTSGSISEENWSETMKICIALAKKLNIDLYFNSFSDYLSPTTKLKLQGRSQGQIYKQLSSIPKVTGGTSYKEIWEFINRSKKRIRELSIIITDFEYIAPSEFIRHPKNLYYIPCTTNHRMDWGKIQSCGQAFCESMLHNDPQFRKHMLC